MSGAILTGDQWCSQCGRKISGHAVRWWIATNDPTRNCGPFCTQQCANMSKPQPKPTQWTGAGPQP